MNETPFPLTVPTLSDQDLLEVEEQVLVAVNTRSVDHLNVFGLGEISVAIGWPTDEPVAVVKRLIPNPDPQRTLSDIEQVRGFRSKIEERGGAVLPTDLRTVTRDDGHVIPYMVQPAVPRAMLAETVLDNDQPVAEHPLLVALYDYVERVSTDRFSIDPQIPNFAWHEGGLWLFDFSTPQLYDADGNFAANFDSGLLTLPALVRPVASRQVSKIFEYYRSHTGALTQTIVFLKRIGADRWVEPALETFNARLSDPIHAATVEERYRAQVKEFPQLKRLVQIQRTWIERVRREQFEFIITDSFAGTIL